MHGPIDQLKKCLWYLEQPTFIWKIKRNFLSVYLIDEDADIPCKIV